MELKSCYPLQKLNESFMGTLARASEEQDLSNLFYLELIFSNLCSTSGLGSSEFYRYLPVNIGT
jgi:hypothetical protein